jgi:hypothetical protein
VGRVCRILWLVFKVGLPLGVAFLVLGTVALGLYKPQHFGNRVSPRVSAIAETILSVACAALAVLSVLDAYIYARGFAKSVRFAISGAIVNAFAGILFASITIVLGVMAVRDWSQP